MNDYGISEYAPEFAKNFPEKAQDLVKYLEDEIGVPTQCSLNDITVEDLLESNLLKKGAAKKLVSAWKQETAPGLPVLQAIRVENAELGDNYYGSINCSKNSSSFGDYAQIGGSRNVYHSAVDRSRKQTVCGDNAQLGGTQNSYNEHAPEFATNCQEEAQNLVKYLKDVMGVPLQCSLTDITEEDLLESKLLKKGAARKLIKGWKKENATPTRRSRRSEISINANHIGEVRNAKRDYNEENYYGSNDCRKIGKDLIEGDKNIQSTTIKSSNLFDSTVANVKGKSEISHGRKRRSVENTKEDLKQMKEAVKREAMKIKNEAKKAKRKCMDGEEISQDENLTFNEVGSPANKAISFTSQQFLLVGFMIILSCLWSYFS